MRRIRLVFALLGLVVLGALSALVATALGGIARDRDERHRALAERAFEEIQRELSRLLVREQARPFSHFDFYYVPEAVSPGRYVVARSPLSVVPGDDWLIGYFQIDPDGTLYSPLIPRERDFYDFEARYTIGASTLRCPAEIPEAVGEEQSGPRDIDKQNPFAYAEPDDLLHFGLIPELVGRLPVVVALESLDEESLVRILVEPKNAITKQYQKLFELENVGLTFDQEALKAAKASGGLQAPRMM